MKAMKSISIALVMLLVATWVGLSVSEGSVSKWLQRYQIERDNPYPESSRLHKPFQAMMVKLLEHPQISAMIKQNKNKQSLFELSKQKAQQGLVRLDDDMLVLRAELMNKVYAGMSDGACCQMIRGRMETSEDALRVMENAMAGLTDEEIVQWFDFSYQALAADFDGLPVKALSPEAIQMALTEVVSGIDGPKREAFANALQNPSESSDADLAWAYRTLFSSISKMQGPNKFILARAVVTQ